MCGLGSCPGLVNGNICGNATDTATRFEKAAPYGFSGRGSHFIRETKAMKNIFQTIRQWRRGNTTAKMLNRLDDRMLADIGVARGDIHKVAYIPH